MKESHRKGVASHPAPESCGAARKDGAEALTGERAGEVWSREIRLSGVPTPLSEAEGNTGGGVSASPPRTPRGRRPSACTEAPCTGTGRSQGPPRDDGSPERAGKASGCNPAAHDPGKSDRSILPKKLPNNAHPPAGKAAEAVEGRDLTKRNSPQSDTSRTQSRINDVPSGLERVRQAAKRDKKTRFTALMHHVTPARLGAAFEHIKPQAAPGIDGVTWEAYGEHKLQNLKELHGRLMRGGYRAKPSRRAYIPKGDGGQRPLGVAALEDKIVQGAVADILNAIYECDFLGFSYGFRPGRGPHDALDALTTGIVRKKVNWVLDADIRGFFDAIDHEWMIYFLEHRIADRRILRLVRKWLAAGVLEDGKRTSSEVGTPQGATISPLLANVYLHYVFDLWANQWRNRHAHGDVVIVRYADDTVVGFQHKGDAERFLDGLPERMQKFALQIHQEKTRLIHFGRFASQHRERQGMGKPETFSFLGSTHICGRTRSGRFLVLRHTIKKRMRAKLQEVKDTLRQRMHHPLPEQGGWLRNVVCGYYAYHAVPTNIRALEAFRTQVTRHWLRTLRRRSQKSRVTWERMNQIATRWLPRPRILHPWPEQRFDARTRGRSPVR